jgi:thymidylate synthase
MIMHLKFRNVNDSFRTFVHLFSTDGRCMDLDKSFRRADSRNGKVLMIDEPVTVTYSRPKERVLFNQARDANPFFHLYEALWMLAGRNDVAPVAYYAKRMAEFSDDGKTLNGAYGYRWRHAQAPCSWDDSVGPFEMVHHDQLDILVAHLKADPNSRRAVLQMWNVEDDLLKVVTGKDLCCNLSVMFSLREEPTGGPAKNFRNSETGEVKTFTPMRKVLDMTVINRSNDLVWGMLGADYTTFSFLQEYMAARLGAEVGVYNHVTNNLHAYIERPDWKPEAWLDDNSTYGMWHQRDWPTILPLVNDPKVFEQELPRFVDYFAGQTRKTISTSLLFTDPFLSGVAAPMLDAYDSHKMGGTSGALKMCKDIQADDWRIACEQWFKRRMK